MFITNSNFVGRSKGTWQLKGNVTKRPSPANQQRICASTYRINVPARCYDDEIGRKLRVSIGRSWS